jgi:beta-phosphoglucomutase-like phosphatase (HAD superfamily)
LPIWDRTSLIDSVDFHAKAWQEAFAHFGIRAAFEIAALIP